MVNQDRMVEISTTRKSIEDKGKIDNTAGVAQLVEHHVANVNVVSSSLITRSIYIYIGL